MPLILSGDTGVPASGMPTGSVIQVVTTNYDTAASLTSASYNEITGLATTITPTSATSRIICMGACQIGHNQNTGGALAIYRNSTLIGADPMRWWYFGNANADVGGSISWHYIDSPATTSAITYRVYWKCDNASYSIYLNRTQATRAPETGGSQVDLMEVKG